MSPSLVVLMDALLEWRGARSTLTGGEKREFARWLARARPEIVSGFGHDVAQFRLTCKELQRGGAWPTRRGIGQATVSRHIGALHQRYRVLPIASRGTFLDFVNNVLEQCETERGLMRYLAKS